MPIKSQDSVALRALSKSNERDSTQTLYLEVVGKGRDQHLEAVSKNWFGRLLMWLGWSSASIGVVAKYINDLAQEYLNPNLQLGREENLQVYSDLEILEGKLDSHTIRDTMNVSANEAEKAKRRIHLFKNAFVLVHD